MTKLTDLKKFVEEKFPNQKIIIAAKSEPYRHSYARTGGITVKKGADGLVAALDPVMQAVDGVWVGLSMANADFTVTDERGRVRVPEETKKYTLRRIKVSDEENDAMNNVAPGGFWPLCHQTWVAPIFSDSDWELYKKVNKKFADAIVDELNGKPGVVWLHDYHLVMCSKYIKEQNPKATLGLFWHIPWPDWEPFVRHPHAVEIIDGLLANDLLGFHTRYYANNFIRCSQHIHETFVDNDYQAVVKDGHKTRVLDFPISIDFEKWDRQAKKLDKAYINKVRKKYHLEDKFVTFCAERFVYTKGIKERMQAVDELLQRRPDLIGKLVMLEVTSIPGSHKKLEASRKYHQECVELMYQINERYEDADWKPIIITEYFVPKKELLSLYKIANVGWITTLHDGMNLVAKEYVACHDKGDGVLVLSKFAGAAVEMREAIIINPFSKEELISSIKTVFDMEKEEREWRLEMLRRRVKERNVFWWARNFYIELESIHSECKLTEN